MKVPVKKKKDAIYYVDNKRFYAAIKEYFEKCNLAEAEGKPLPIIPNYIGECFTKIAHKFSTNYRYIGYSYRDEMIDDGIETCIKYIRSFNPEKFNNPFAYFTQTIKNAFWHRIKVERKEQYIKLKSMSNMLLTHSGYCGIDGDDFGVTPEMYDNMHQYISEYEHGIEEKKKKAKAKPLDAFIEEDENEETDSKRRSGV
jgi:hypothetical protein